MLNDKKLVLGLCRIIGGVGAEFYLKGSSVICCHWMDVAVICCFFRRWSGGFCVIGDSVDVILG